jgi:RNA polymerase sigma-70 factor (ECF subfamily)
MGHRAGAPVWSHPVDDLTTLLVASRDGGPGTFAEVVRAAQPEVWRFVAHLVGPADADDVTQDCFVRAHRARAAYRGDASARTWLLAIARRAAADHVRGRQRGRRLRARLEQHARPRVHTAGAAIELEDLVARLEPGRREAFVLTQVVGCSYEEAAGICGVPVGTIRSRVARAREELVARARAAETA